MISWLSLLRFVQQDLELISLHDTFCCEEENLPIRLVAQKAEGKMSDASRESLSQSSLEGSLDRRTNTVDYVN